MVADLGSARAAATGPTETNVIDHARFITCIPVLDVTRCAGQMGDCYGWICTAVAPTHDRTKLVNNNTYTFPIGLQPPSALAGLYIKYIPHFAGACFYVAYKFGGLDALAEYVARACWVITSDHHRKNADDDVALEAMAQMVIWAGHRAWPDGQAWATELLAAGQRTSSPSQRFKVVLAFTSPANRFVDGTPEEWAARALDEHSGAMEEHERLQMLALVLRGPEDWRMRRAEILAEITHLRSLYLAMLQPGEVELEVLEHRVSVIHPLVFALGNWGEIDDLIDLLGAWYRAPDAEPADTNLLAILPTLNGGAAYLWPGGRWLTGTGDWATHNAMMQAVKPALGIYFRGTDGDHPPEAFEDFRFGFASAAAGYNLEAAMEAHYRFGELRERLPADWVPRATVVFPSSPEPVQAMLAKAAKVVAPLEISFQQPRPPRPIRRVAVWAPDGLMHGVFEVDAIRHVGNRAGWTVDVQQPEEPTSEDLRRFYENEEADLVWVISHGAHDAYTTRGTGLHLPDETLIGLDEIGRWEVPGNDRRLLVLNSCSGASAQGRGGLARIGLAQSLVSGRQAVVGHLWPVHWTAGLAFGAALAACLEDDPTEAAALAAAGLMQEHQRLLTFLEDRFHGCEELLNRLRRSPEDMDSLTNWGCPVLLT